jgi:hypothetical protein
MTQVERSLKADQIADKFAAKLFKNGIVTVRKANTVYSKVKKILLENISE